MGLVVPAPKDPTSAGPDDVKVLTRLVDPRTVGGAVRSDIPTKPLVARLAWEGSGGHMLASKDGVLVSLVRRQVTRLVAEVRTAGE